MNQLVYSSHILTSLYIDIQSVGENHLLAPCWKNLQALSHLRIYKDKDTITNICSVFPPEIGIHIGIDRIFAFRTSKGLFIIIVTL